VCINATLLVYATLDVPMGGTGLSGLGRRHGAVGITRFTNTQSIVGSVGKWGGYESIVRAVQSERRARLVGSAFKAWLRIPGLR